MCVCTGTNSTRAACYYETNGQQDFSFGHKAQLFQQVTAQPFAINPISNTGILRTWYSPLKSMHCSDCFTLAIVPAHCNSSKEHINWNVCRRDALPCISVKASPLYALASSKQAAPDVCFGSSSVFQFLFGYLGRCSCSFTSIDTLSAWHYDFQVCSRWWSRSSKYFVSLFVENVYGVWPLSWTLTRQALQSLRAMPDQCTHRNIAHLAGCAACRCGCRGGQLHAKLILKPGSYSQIPDVTVNRRNSITSWLYTHYILYYMYC